MRARLTIALLLGLIPALAPSTAQAAITVANTNDSGAGSLRKAIEEAPPGETIVVPPGTYSLTSGELVIKQGLTISGAGAAATTIRAAGPFRVFDVETAPATIARVTIRDGTATGGLAFGGGVRSMADLTLRSVVVTANTASSNGAAGMGGGLAFGGGVWVEAKLTLADSQVTGNVATAVGGSEGKGGLAEGGGVWSIGPLAISNSTVSSNLADARGGQGPANAKQDGGLAEGGGLWAIQEGKGDTAVVVGSTFASNVVTGGPGPGGKNGLTEGGGVWVVSEEAPAFLFATTIASNVARHEAVAPGLVEGGGLWAVAEKPNGGVTVNSSTLSGNRLETAGTGVVEGGNLYASGPVRLRNTIVADGFGVAGAENCNEPSEPISDGFNLESTDQCGFKAAGDIVNANPLLGPLQMNGGPTPTMAPSTGQPGRRSGRQRRPAHRSAPAAAAGRVPGHPQLGRPRRRWLRDRRGRAAAGDRPLARRPDQEQEEGDRRADGHDRPARRGRDPDPYRQGTEATDDRDRRRGRAEVEHRLGQGPGAESAAQKGQAQSRDRGQIRPQSRSDSDADTQDEIDQEAEKAEETREKSERTHSVTKRLPTAIALALATTAMLAAAPAQAEIVVANTNDSGAGSLRKAVEEAPDGETIRVPAGTYTMSSEQLVIVDPVKIVGNGPGQTVIRSGGFFRVVEIAGAGDVEISGVTIRDGRHTAKLSSAAGVLSASTNLTLRDVRVTGNISNAVGAATEDGGRAEGSGIVAVGSLTLIGSTVANNLATAVGGEKAEGGDALGAGVLVVGSLTMVNSTIVNNTADARGGQGFSDAGQSAEPPRAPGC